ncbi:oxidoreductase-like domain-containing protein [Paraburkholderia sp. GAS334]|uniref:oxidoreductase-like domain-containing protein n=1 Tax=unclassified Paraburkholderia TaxID=2615204 RepID=UPI003D25D308
MPVPPRQPELEDCCGSGCDPCIFDLYADELERYRVALAAWEARHRTRGSRGAHEKKPSRPRS